MTFTVKSRIQDAWGHPLGHDVLQLLMRRIDRDENWPAKPRAGRMRLEVLDRWAGAGFAQTLADMLNRHPGGAPAPAAPGRAWWKEAVVYHIYVPSFMDGDHDGLGDLRGIMQRLPYLQQLGVDAVWAWPLVEATSPPQFGTFGQRTIISDIGTTEDVQALTDALHQRGMKLFAGMGLVFTWDDHPWFKKALEGDKKCQEYYIFKNGKPSAPPNNWSAAGSSSAWGWYEDLGAWGLHLMGRRRMDLNWANEDLRREAVKVLRFWQQQGVDAMVLGGVNMIDKTGMEGGGAAMAELTGLRGYEYYAFGPHMHRYLRQLKRESNRNKEMVLMGETKGCGTGMSRTLAGDGAQLDMVLDTTHLQMGGRNTEGNGDLTLLDLKKYYLKWMEEYAADRWMPLLLESPDHPRMVSRLGVSPVYRSILAKLLGTMVLTLRGTPVIYQGQELGLMNTKFRNIEELRHGVSLRTYAEYRAKYGEAEAFRRVVASTPDHARTPMPWASGPKGGFTGAEPWLRLPDGVDYLNAAAQMQDKHSVWSHYRALIGLRKSNECLVYGEFRPVFAQHDKVFCYFRILEKERWYIEMNISERQVSRPGRLAPTMHLMLSNYDSPSDMLRPYEANVYRCEN